MVANANASKEPAQASKKFSPCQPHANPSTTVRRLPSGLGDHHLRGHRVELPPQLPIGEFHLGIVLLSRGALSLLNLLDALRRGHAEGRAVAEAEDRMHEVGGSEAAGAIAGERVL